MNILHPFQKIEWILAPGVTREISIFTNTRRDDAGTQWSSRAIRQTKRLIRHPAIFSSSMSPSGLLSSGLSVITAMTSEEIVAVSEATPQTHLWSWGQEIYGGWEVWEEETRTKKDQEDEEEEEDKEGDDDEKEEEDREEEEEEDSEQMSLLES